MLIGYSQTGNVVVHHDVREGRVSGTIKLEPVAASAPVGASLKQNLDDAFAQKYVGVPHRPLKDAPTTYDDSTKPILIMA